MTIKVVVVTLIYTLISQTTKQNRNIYTFLIYLGSINLLFLFHFFNFVIKKTIQLAMKYYKIGLFQNILILKNYQMTVEFYALINKSLRNKSSKKKVK